MLRANVRGLVVFGKKHHNNDVTAERKETIEMIDVDWDWKHFDDNILQQLYFKLWDPARKLKMLEKNISIFVECVRGEVHKTPNGIWVKNTLVYETFYIRRFP